MKNKAALSALLGVLAEQVYAQGVQCGNNRWGLNRQSNSDCWLKWSGWSECAGHCGQSTQTATRKCRGNIPGMGGCQGSELRRQRCRDNQVVQGKDSYCPYWSFWSEWGACQVQGSNDPCVRNVHGYQRRTRTCHDPYASERGETPQCQGEELEQKTCTNSLQGYPVLPKPEYQQGPWSQCNSQCGDGVQTCMRTHICANVANTWVPESDWYRQEERVCQVACCQASAEGMQYDEQNEECNGGYSRQFRYFTDYYGGCETARQTNPNLRRVSTYSSQYIEEITTQIPVYYPPAGQFEYCEEPQYSPCVEQALQSQLSLDSTIQAWIAEGKAANAEVINVQMFNVLTTANGNGLESRSRKHCCVNRCQPHSCPQWQQPPYQIFEERRCGPAAKLAYRNTCGMGNDCAPRCFAQFIDALTNKVIQESEINCGFDVCGVRRQPEQCSQFNTCTCGQLEKTQTCTTPCAPPTVSSQPCVEDTQVYISEWQESAQLVEYRQQGRCVCKAWESFWDSKSKQVTITAEDSRICNRVSNVVENRASTYATETCWTPEVCDQTTCDGSCMATYTCTQTDECTGAPRVTRTVPCSSDPVKDCCELSPWKVVSECPNTFQCPSEGFGAKREYVRYTINRMTGTQDETCKGAEYKSENCPRIPCPAWGEWTQWSGCSNIKPDGTHCGGNRLRNRNHPCPNDVAQGSCLPEYSAGLTFSDGNRDDLYQQYDSFTPQHHSEFCYSQMDMPNMWVQVGLTDWIRDENNYGCVNGTHYRMIRTISFQHKCSDEVRSETEEQLVQIPPCIEVSVPVTQLPRCEDTNNDVACCRYAQDECSAMIQRVCLSQDRCQANRASAAVEQASFSQCPISDPKVNRVQLNACTPQEGNPLLDPRFCVGMCNVQDISRCGVRGEPYPVECELSPETFQWSEWSTFSPLVPFDQATAIELQTIGNGLNMSPIYVNCNPCGGKLVSSRRRACAVTADGTGIEEETREVECPVPQYVWTEWVGCESCAMRKQDMQCTRNRKRVTAPAAMHCAQVQVDSDFVEVPPCPQDCSVSRLECQNQLDPTANCGTGSLHNITTKQTCNFEGDVLSVGYTTVNIVVGANGQQQECDLPYQRQLVNLDTFGCQSLQEQCNGGIVRQNRALRCVEADARAAVGFREELSVVEVSACPALPVVDIKVEETECLQCQKTKTQTRTCLGGTFQENCKCQQFGRECCVRDLSYALSADGRTETREAPCLMPMPAPEMVEVVQPDCTCECSKWLCPRDVCTGFIDTRTEVCQVLEQGYTGSGYHVIRVEDLSECKWDSFTEGQNECNTLGYQEQMCIHECYNNTRLDQPHVRIDKVYQDSFTANNGFEYSKSNSRYFSQLKRCQYDPVQATRASQCDYTDPCKPVQRVDQTVTCNGKEQIVASTTQPCGEVPEPYWTAWSECSVECGEGTMSRKLIQQCSNTVLNVEEKQCGCPISRWSEWSAWVGVCQECGPEVQTKTQSRTCIEPASQYSQYSTTADQYVTYMSNGLYRSRLASVPVDNTCADKCNLCQADADGFSSVRTSQFSRDVECPSLKSVVVDNCPTGAALCNNRFTTKRIMQCGKEVGSEQLPCPEPPTIGFPIVSEGPCMDSRTNMEITTCGNGFKTVTTQADICSAPYTQQVACTGPMGTIVQNSAGAWSSCSTTCGGGQMVRTYETVCSDNGYVIDARQEFERCAMHPCAYWGGWSQWSMCSSTCGSGQRQRTRKCEGGAPGTGGCLDMPELFTDPIDQIEKPFTPVGNGAIHTVACDDGPCCEFEWSGWSNCCIDNDNSQKRLRWKGNQCTGEWKSANEGCGATADSLGKLQTCEALYSINRQYFSGSVDSNTMTIVKQDTTTWSNTQAGWNVMYGRQIANGYYTIGGQTYKLVSVGDEQTWYLVNLDGSEVVVDVEYYKYSQGQGYSTTHYYRFGSTWYKYINDNFAYYGSTPPFYVSKVVTSASASSSSSSSYATYGQVPNRWAYQPVAVTSYSSAASSVTSNNQVYKPVYQMPVTTPVAVSQTLTVVEDAAEGSVLKPVQQPMASHSSSSSSSNVSFKSEADTKNSLFGSW